ncbi:MAG: peptide chain release factor N(5)-glutamine methyltransferase [Pseudomonadota bacterium]
MTLDPRAGGGIRETLTTAAARFDFSGTPRLDAELLLAHALGVTRERLLLDPPTTVPPEFAALVDRRAAREPVAYITGIRAFWTIELAVGPGVLIPRADSETLLEAAVEYFGGRAPATILDLGTGPGTLLLAALDQWPTARGVGIDASDIALEYATNNGDRLRLGDRARFMGGGWEGTGERFDLILCNPPYVATGETLPREVAEYEPAQALFGGADGLDDYRRIAPLLGAQLAPGGCACIEIGHTQAATVTALFERAGLTVILHRDLAGRDRCLVVTA